MRNERSLLVSKEIEAMMLASFKMNSEEVYQRFNDLKKKLKKIGKTTAEECEIERRIEEAKVSILFERTDASGIFMRAWADMLRAGFSTAEREASMLFYYVTHLIEVRGCRRKIGVALARLSSLINDELCEMSKEQCDHFSYIKEELQRRFETELLGCAGSDNGFKT